MDSETRWREEARRLHDRYLIEVVEACGLCPWAERSRRTGRTRSEVVLPAGDDALAPALALLDSWGDDLAVEIGFLIFPRLNLSRSDFDRFVARMRDLDSQRCAIGEIPFALAAFHPDAALDLADPERLIPFLRRTPDPCIQAVRMATLKRVRSGTPDGTQFVDLASMESVLLSEAKPPPLRERIALANLVTVRRMGAVEFTARLEDIQSDRRRTYADLEALEGPTLDGADAEPATALVQNYESD